MLRAFLKNEGGGFAAPAALSTLALIIGTGVAIDFAIVQSTKVQMQNQIDRAVLAAAIHPRGHVLDGVSAQSQESSAKEIALNYLAIPQNNHQTIVQLDEFSITDMEVSAVGQVKVTPIFSGILGINDVTVKVSSSANIISHKPKDIDVVLIADATGSMGPTLSAIQDNMKSFTFDLEAELVAHNIKVDSVRVQFVFYRDLMIDNHKDWTGPTMPLKLGMEKKGALYSSSFFTLPLDTYKMSTYVDFFKPFGGGSTSESGLEAVWLALNANWREANTLRSIILWTDAPTKSLGDKVEQMLAPAPNLDAFWNWKDTIGDFFVTMNQSQRQDYMFNTFYPTDMPQTMAEFKTKFDKFHSENSNGVENVKTMTINVMNNCSGRGSSCTDWPELANWDGAELILDKQPIASDATYRLIVKQVASTVTSQAAAKDLAITH